MKLILISFLWGSSLFAADFNITEGELGKMAKKSNPSLNEIEATFLDSKIRAKELEDKFGYELYAGMNHSNTKEKSTISFQPVFTNVNQYKVGVKKYTKYGIVLDLNRSVDIRSGSSESGSDYKDMSTTTNELGVQIDLWKDFLGAVTNSQVKNLQDMQKKDDLQSKISKRVFEVNVRKLYWNLVANHEKIKITNRLYKTAKKQAADARKRRANSVADRAEVARFESLVHQRKGSLLVLRHKRESLHKSLREMFPVLNEKELKMGSYNLDQTIFQVLACTTQIDKEKITPTNHSDYTEVVKLLRGIKDRQGKVDRSYDDIDVKLDLKLREVGVASESSDGTNYEGSYEDSLTDLSDNDRSGMVAGLIITIPFGEDKGSTQEVKEILTEKRFESSINKLDSDIKSTHLQIKRSVKLLGMVIQEQKSNSQKLKTRVKEMTKKYKQARIPEYALIQDQDLMLESDLAVIDTQLMILSTVLNYFTVFNNYPCAFNRI